MASTVPELAYESDAIFEKAPVGEPAASTYLLSCAWFETSSGISAGRSGVCRSQ